MATRTRGLPVEERFALYVEVNESDECWPWAGYCLPDGYGSFWAGELYPNGSPKKMRAHRFAYFLAHGSLPAELEVCHSCDNPPCCNPAHLFLGTHADNMGDLASKGRAARQPGEENGRARLKAADVAFIRSSSEPVHVIAARFNVTTRNIRLILRGETWKES